MARESKQPPAPRKAPNDEPATGAGAEATHNTGAPPGEPNATGEARDREHLSGYGGDGGRPKSSSDQRED